MEVFFLAFCSPYMSLQMRMYLLRGKAQKETFFFAKLPLLSLKNKHGIFSCLCGIPSLLLQVAI